MGRGVEEGVDRGRKRGWKGMGREGTETEERGENAKMLPSGHGTAIKITNSQQLLLPALGQQRMALLTISYRLGVELKELYSLL